MHNSISTLSHAERRQPDGTSDRSRRILQQALRALAHVAHDRPILMLLAACARVMLACDRSAELSSAWLVKTGWRLAGRPRRRGPATARSAERPRVPRR